MRREVGGRPKYLSFNDFEAGDLMCKGEFVEWTESKFGLTTVFMLEDGSNVQLPFAGDIKKHHPKGTLKVGSVYEVEYHGLEVMKGGNYKGTSAHQVKFFSVDSPKPEVEEPKEEGEVEDTLELDEFANF